MESASVAWEGLQLPLVAPEEYSSVIPLRRSRLACQYVLSPIQSTHAIFANRGRAEDPRRLRGVA